MPIDYDLPHPPPIDYRKLSPEDILANQFLRLNTLYHIIDEHGRRKPFRMKPEQFHVFEHMHNLNIVTKARQLGMTSFIQMLLLDFALFNPNKSCGVIAHNREDAQKFFDKKIKFAYDNIPADFKRQFVPEADQDRAGQLKFGNGSYISVGTTMRSDTLQFLHVSEFGKMCAQFPAKADEVVSGALNAIAPGQIVFIESTGEGAHGHFYNMATEAKRLHDEGVDLTAMDYKFFFFPWWQAPKYELHEPVNETPDDIRYFTEIEKTHKIKLSLAKRKWYVKKKREQREKMFREYPTIPEECFVNTLGGAPFGPIMAGLRQRGHITRVPWARSAPVNTFWDLGRNDKMAIWFHQRVGFEDRFIDYHEDNFLPLDHYAAVLKDKPYVYGEHYLPHDIEVTDLSRSDGLTRREVLTLHGVKPIIVVPRIESEMEAVEQTRSVMDGAWFDGEKCAQGIRGLENLRFRWDENLQAFQPNLLRTWAKHGADAYMQWGHGYRHRASRREEKADTSEIARVNRGGRMERARAKQSFGEDWRL